MDLNSIFLTLSALRLAAQELVGPLTAIGVDPRAASLVGTALDIANDVKKAIDNGQAIASAEDQASIDAVIEDLQAEANRLAAAVDAT